MTLKCDPRTEHILQLKIVRLSHFCGETCPIFHDFCVIFLTSSSVVPIQKSHTRHTSTVLAEPSPSSFVTALFIFLNPDSICRVSLVNIYNILHKCVMASQFPRNECHSHNNNVSRNMDSLLSGKMTLKRLGGEVKTYLGGKC